MSRVPDKHTVQGGRHNVFPADLPLDAAFGANLEIAVASPIVVITSIIDAMFEKSSSPARNIGTATLLRIANARNVHPDSVLVIAMTIFKHWKEGVVPYIVFTSYHVPDPSLPLSDSINASKGICIDYRPRDCYDATHIASLECADECLCSDNTNYIYKPTAQLESDAMRIVILSYGPMYNETQTKKLRDSMTAVRVFDSSWSRMMATSMAGRMSPLLVIKLCFYTANQVGVKGVNISFSLRREGSLIRLSLPCNSLVQLDRSSLAKELGDARKQSAASVNPMCVQCELRYRVVRCSHCDDLRYCTRECADADAAKHEKACRVYIRRNAVEGPRAPGGAIVMKQKE